MSIVLSKNGIIFSKTKPIGLKNYESLVSLIAALVKKAKLSIEDFDCLSVCVGPGSFTGIRIGVSTVKALAYAIQVPVVGYKSLDLDAWMVNDSFPGLLCVMRDARRNNVYAAVYRRDACMRKVGHYFLCTFAELAMKIEGIHRSWHRGTRACPTEGRQARNPALFFYGDAVVAHQYEIQNRFPHSRLLPQKSHYHKARAMISLTKKNIHDATTPFRLTPFYLYPRDCQVHKSGAKQ